MILGKRVRAGVTEEILALSAKIEVTTWFLFRARHYIPGVSELKTRSGFQVLKCGIVRGEGGGRGFGLMKLQRRGGFDFKRGGASS